MCVTFLDAGDSLRHTLSFVNRRHTTATTAVKTANNAATLQLASKAPCHCSTSILNSLLRAHPTLHAHAGMLLPNGQRTFIMHTFVGARSLLAAAGIEPRYKRRRGADTGGALQEQGMLGGNVRAGCYTSDRSVVTCCVDLLNGLCHQRGWVGGVSRRPRGRGGGGLAFFMSHSSHSTLRIATVGVIHALAHWQYHSAAASGGAVALPASSVLV